MRVKYAESKDKVLSTFLKTEPQARALRERQYSEVTFKLNSVISLVKKKVSLNPVMYFIDAY